MSTITVKDVSVGYDRENVLEHINVSIPKEKVTIIIGSNGCGKSTLLKTIARILKSRDGEILINHQNIKKIKTKALAQMVAVLPQSPQTPPGLLVKELVSYGRFPYQSTLGGLQKEDFDVIHWALKETGLNDLEQRALDQLSGGQRQRAWIAMALAQQTEILLLDEPTTYLDMSYQLEILNLLQKMNRENQQTIVMVLHELNLACRFADHIIGMKEGKIMFEGSPKDVITVHNLEKIYGVKVELQESKHGGYPVCVDYNF